MMRLLQGCCLRFEKLASMGRENRGEIMNRGIVNQPGNTAVHPELDVTTGLSTRLSKDDSQVAGYIEGHLCEFCKSLQ
jgi:hypothetical protein